MRMLMKVTIPTQQGTTAIREGRLQGVMEQTLGRLKPEAAYFFPDHGQRSGFVVFDMTDPSELPAITEPLFGINAIVEFVPAMNADELRKGLSSLDAAGSAQAQGR